MPFIHDSFRYFKCCGMNFINYYSWKGNRKVNGAVWRCELCKTFVRRVSIHWSRCSLMESATTCRMSGVVSVQRWATSVDRACNIHICATRSADGSTLWRTGATPVTSNTSERSASGDLEKFVTAITLAPCCLAIWQVRKVCVFAPE